MASTALEPRFAAALAALSAPSRLLVAVSGGSDSMALLLLAAQWADARPYAQLWAATVDHGLRPESASEAAQVARFCAQRGLEHRVLTLPGLAALPGNLPQNARQARYAALTACAVDVGAEAVLTAHTQTDQAETVLLHLARGSGIDGLAGIPARRDGVVPVLRPLLRMGRAELRSWLTAQGVGWIDDPSNADARFARPRLRAALAARQALGLSDDRLALMAEHAARAQAALAAGVADLRARALVDGVLDLAVYARAPVELRFRLLRDLIRAAHPPRAEAIQALDTALLSPDFRGRTLGRWLFRPGAGNKVQILPAPPRHNRR